MSIEAYLQALLATIAATPHYPELPNFPHHRHGDREPSVVTATPPDLSTVLKEIERFSALED